MGDEASRVYGNQVANIIAGQSRNSPYKPAEPIELFVKNRRQPASLAELNEIEREQLSRIFDGADLEQRLASGMFEADGEEYPDDLELAEVVDDSGVVRYRLWGMNYGVVFLMAAASLDCIAFACQHDLEHWHSSQRPIFWAMDRAMARGDHGFQQPMKFCWWEDKCWADIAELEPGTVQSQGAVLARFG